MGMDWGIGVGAGVTSAFKTFGEMMDAIQQARQFKMQQQEQQAMQGANGTPTPVDGAGSQAGGQIVQSLQGGPDNKADPEAAFNAIQGVTNAKTPIQAQQAMSAAQQQGAAANAAATPDLSQAPPPGQGGGAPAAAAPAPAAAQPTGSSAALPPGQVGGIGAGGAPSGAAAPVAYNSPTAAAAPGAGSNGTTTGTGAPAAYGGSTGADPQVVKNTLAGINQVETSGGKNWNPDPKSGAVGGIMDATWKQYAQPGESKSNPADVQAVQQRIVTNLASQFGNDPGKIATAWFSGPGNVNTAPDATTPYKNNASDGRLTTQQYVNRVTSYANRLNTVDSHGSATDENGNAALTSDTKIEPITAKALPGGIASDNYTFSKDAQGNITMQKTATAAQRAMAAANKAYQLGDMKNAGPLMQAAVTMQQQEATQNVSKIMQNSDMSQDEKVGALARLGGATAYKTEKGSYLVPGLGPTDTNGNPAPMSYQQVAALSQWMTTPEGIQHAMEYNVQNQQLQVSQQQANAQTAQAAAATTNAQTNAKGEAARENLENTQAGYYGSFKTAQTQEAQGKAAEAAAQADLRQRMSKLEDAMGNLNPSSPTYKQDMQHLQAQHAMLVQRSTGRVDTSQPKQTTYEPGKLYSDPDNPGQLVTPNTYTGKVMPVRQSQAVDALAQQITSSPVLKSTYRIGVDGDNAGISFQPDVAEQYGLDPTKIYPTLTQAQRALTSSPKYTEHVMGVALPSAPQVNQSDLAAGGIPQ